jgi:hypothetical protein|tara:strand:+ start:1119 stop:1346 length:228 start_codon:yes stop_codon:yes gene_type:complete
MKTRETIKKEASKISEQDIKTLQATVEEINMILHQKTINEDLLTKLTNILTTINSLRDNYIWRMLRAAKQNHMLD